MMIEVNEFGGFGDGGVRGVFNGGGIPDEGDDGAIVIVILMMIQNAPACRLDRGGDLIDHFRAATFGEVGNAFDKHRELSQQLGDGSGTVEQKTKLI